MIHLHPTNLIAVPVPEDASRILISATKWLCYRKDMKAIPLVDEPLTGKHIILGTVTKDTIDFDVEPYIENDSGPLLWKCYSGKYTGTTNKHEAFRSLLSANEAYFENPYGEHEPQEPKTKTNGKAFKLLTKRNQWQTSQSKVNKKYVILHKI